MWILVDEAESGQLAVNLVGGVVQLSGPIIRLRPAASRIINLAFDDVESAQKCYARLVESISAQQCMSVSRAEGLEHAEFVVRQEDVRIVNKSVPIRAVEDLNVSLVEPLDVYITNYEVKVTLDEPVDVNVTNDIIPVLT
jgi:hypothetical protein